MSMWAKKDAAPSWLATVAAALLILWLANNAQAADSHQLAGAGAVVVYPTGFEQEAEKTLQVYQGALEQFQREIGVLPTEPVQIVLCGTEADFNRITGGRRDVATLGLAYPGRGLIVINCQRLGAPGFDSLQITVRHEACHLAVETMRRLGGRPVPYWFNEGLAVYTSGRLPLPGQGWLPTYVARDNALALADIEQSFPSASSRLRVAYEQSVSIVRFLVHEFGPDALKQVCVGMSQGSTFEAALGRATGLTTAELEARWLESLGVGNTLMVFVLRHFSIFTIMSLLALVGILRYLIRRRRAYIRWKREEAELNH